MRLWSSTPSHGDRTSQTETVWPSISHWKRSRSACRGRVLRRHNSPTVRSMRLSSSSLKDRAALYYPEQATSVTREDRDLPVTVSVARARDRGLGLTTICTSWSSAFR